jgi:putative transposase
LKFPNELGALRRFWQKRFYDFNVWSGKKLQEKLEYMHANPVIRGLVKHPKDWAWSSWGFYKNGESGLVKIDPME